MHVRFTFSEIGKKYQMAYIKLMDIIILILHNGHNSTSMFVSTRIAVLWGQSFTSRHFISMEMNSKHLWCDKDMNRNDGE